MELQDSAYELVQSVMATTDTAAAFQGVHVAILLGGFPRKEGMERRDLIEKVRSSERLRACIQHCAGGCST
jgi:malate dehydrogenase